jgi:hypothetical protein
MGNKGQVKYHRIAPFLWVIEMIFLDPFHLSVRLKHRLPVNLNIQLFGYIFDLLLNLPIRRINDHG